MFSALPRITLDEIEEEPRAFGERLATLRRAVLEDDRGEALAVLLSPSEYCQLENERELLRLLALGELECAAGHGKPLDEVMDDCDLLLEES